MTPDEIESEQRLWEQFESGVNEARRLARHPGILTAGRPAAAAVESLPA